MYEITTELGFSAAHRLKDYNGPCENIHGHNWLVRATVRSTGLNAIGIGIDFRDLKEALKNVLEKLDHADLNALFEGPVMNPSSENIARYIYEELGNLVGNQTCRVYRVEVYETPGNSATYMDDRDA